LVGRPQAGFKSLASCWNFHKLSSMLLVMSVQSSSFPASDFSLAVYRCQVNSSAKTSTQSLAQDLRVSHCQCKVGERILVNQVTSLVELAVDVLSVLDHSCLASYSHWTTARATQLIVS